MNKELIILAGANGSGKSTFASELITETNYPFLNADEIEKNLGGNCRFEAGKVFFKTFEEYLEQEISFITESTLSGVYLLRKMQEAKAKSYKLTIIYVFLENPEHCIARVKTRVSKGGHHIPDEDVKRRFYRSKQNFWERYKSLADDWFLYFNGLQEVQRVALGSENNYLVENESLFEKFLKI